MEYLGISQIPFSIIFTKADKLKPNAINRHIEVYNNELLKTWEELPKYFVTSSTKSLGRDEVLQFIEETNLQINTLRNT
jgi:GTP-binding protein